MSTNADATPAAAAGGEDAAATQVVSDAKATGGRDSTLLKLSVVVMVVGIVVSIIGYVISHGTTSSLTQNDALTIAIIGISVTVAGGAFFVRYSFSAFMRFWLARLTFELRDDR
ncbi:MAG TPA: hypothetical protein VHX15_13835 [Frankiaceae bacterium]|jgi:cytochrome c biogenesis protein CcdA|nr:hypothetical protein [Frankiaceae bacterium]